MKDHSKSEKCVPSAIIILGPFSAQYELIIEIGSNLRIYAQKFDTSPETQTPFSLASNGRPPHTSIYNDIIKEAILTSTLSLFSCIQLYVGKKFQFEYIDGGSSTFVCNVHNIFWRNIWNINYVFYTAYYLLTYSMEQSPSWEANWFAASQEIPHILWNPNAHYRIHKCRTPVPILSQINPVHNPHPASWEPFLLLSSHLRLGLPSGLFPTGFPTKTLYTVILSPIRATCPAHLILLDLNTPTKFGQQYRSLNFSLCSFLQSLITSSFLGPNIPPQHPILEHSQPSSSLNVSYQVSNPYKTTGKVKSSVSLYILIATWKT